MPCIPFTTPNGGRGFMCTTRSRPPICNCGSGRRATLACDWKVATRKSGTCDAKLCTACTHVPAPEKDLCPSHAAEWKARQQETASR